MVKPRGDNENTSTLVKPKPRRERQKEKSLKEVAMSMVTPGGEVFTKYAPQMRPVENQYDKKMYNMLAGKSNREIASSMVTMGDVYGNN